MIHCFYHAADLEGGVMMPNPGESYWDFLGRIAYESYMACESRPVRDAVPLFKHLPQQIQDQWIVSAGAVRTVVQHEEEIENAMDHEEDLK